MTTNENQTNGEVPIKGNKYDSHLSNILNRKPSNGPQEAQSFFSRFVKFNKYDPNALSNESDHNVDIPVVTPNLTETHKINREELIQGTKGGIHVVETPLIGYKTIHCECNEFNSLWSRFASHNRYKPIKTIISCVAKVEIPCGAIVVRSVDNFCSFFKRDFSHLVANNCHGVRTNMYTVADITPIKEWNWSIDYSKIDKCRSMTSSNYEYEKGKSYSEPVDMNIRDGMTYGLHFFLGKTNQK